MSVHRYGARRDSNEAEIVEALRRAGAKVYLISKEGFTDTVIAYNGVTYLAEIKTRKGRLQPAQVAFFETWTGGPIAVIRTVEEALKFIGATD